MPPSPTMLRRPPRVPARDRRVATMAAPAPLATPRGGAVTSTPGSTGGAPTGAPRYAASGGAAPAPGARSDASPADAGGAAAGPGAAGGGSGSSATAAPGPDAGASPARAPGGAGFARLERVQRRETDDPSDPFGASLDDVDTGADLAMATPGIEETEAASVPDLPESPVPTADWSAPTQLAADALVLPPVPKTPDDQKKTTQPAPDAEALGVARTQYAALVAEASRAQAEFIRAARLGGEAMGEVYQDEARRTLDGHHANLEEVERLRVQALAELDRSAAAADGALEIAFRNTVVTAGMASRRAHGRISANYQRADVQINTILGGLVAGHVRNFDAAISEIGNNLRDATNLIDAWVNARSTGYPTTGAASALAAAQNEERQRRIPPIAERQKGEMSRHKDNTVRAWTTSKDRTVSNIQCTYRCPLDQHKAAINTQGHAQVAEALRKALKSLREQSREGRKAIAATRVAGRGQIEALARAARERLKGEARATLAGIQRETTSAQRGVQQAAESTGAAYPRLARRFEELLTRAAQRGPQALAQVARQSPAELLRSLENLRTSNAERLRANGLRLRRGLGERSQGAERSAAEQVAQADLNLSQAVRDSGPALEMAGEGFSTGFAELAREVLRASDSWAEPFETHFAVMLRSARADVGRQLDSLLFGPDDSAVTDPNQAQAAPADHGAGAGGGTTATPAPTPAAPPAGCAPCETAHQAEADDVANTPQVSGWPPLPEGAGPDPAAADHGTGTGSHPGAPAAGGDAAGGDAAQERPQGLLGQREQEAAFFEERGAAHDFFEQHLVPIDDELHTQLMAKVHQIEHGFEAGFWDPVDEAAITGALHNLTALLGAAVEELWVTEGENSVPLRTDLQRHIDPMNFGDNDDLNACYAYLDGHPEEGAAFELKASIGFFNDDEARIEATMGALSPAQLQRLGRDHGATLDSIAGHLDGTDLRVFDALRGGNYALAGALRLKDTVDSARRDGDLDATNAALTTMTHGTTYSGWQRDMEDRGLSSEDQAREARTATVNALGHLVSDADVAQAAGPGGVAAMSDTDRAVAYVTRPVDVEVGGGGDMPPTTITLRMEGANRDLAEALLRSGDRSVEARAARLGVEMQRTGEEPRPVNVDDAMFDPRFRRLTPDMPRDERLAILRDIREARADREAMVRLAATRYGGANETQTTAAMTDMIASQLTGRMDDAHGRDLVRGLVTEERPSAATMAAAMRYGMYSHTGTDEDLLFHFTERMDRDEIAAMRTAFASQTIDSDHPNGRSLDAELGVFGQGSFGELSGDDALRMERAMLGQPRNDRERFESAMFAMHQQQKETGGFGRWLASGSYAEHALGVTERRLLASVGGSATFNSRGELTGGTAVEMFGPRGQYAGPKREAFMVFSGVAQQVAQNYSARIDAIANGFTMIVAIVGAIVAAAVSVLTAGAASPLLMAAIAGIAGLASMGLNYAIKGGRYGWEQALTDLGMTAVQALTAGIGASLGASAKAAQDAAKMAEQGVAAAASARAALSGVSRIMSGNPIVNQMAIGAVTGAVNGLGSAALNEETWRGGAGDVLGNLVSGTARGAIGGGVSGAVTGAIDNFKIGGTTVSDRMQGMTASGGLLRGGANVALRSLARGGIAAASGVAGRASEIGFDAAFGRFHGDAGDAMLQLRDTALHSFVQGMGEGVTESVLGRFMPHHGAEVETANRRPLTEAEQQAVARGRIGEPVEGDMRPLVAADAAGLPPAAGRALAEAAEAPPAARRAPATEEVEESRARRRGDSEDDDEATPAARPGAQGEETGTRPLAQGTASAVDDDFHGAAARPGSAEAASARTLKGAVRRLLGLGDSEFAGNARLPNPRDATRIALTTDAGQEVAVRIRMSRGTLPPDEHGEIPVARFRFDEASGQYVVEVSAGASRRQVERALAHELAEIRAGHGRGAGEDALRPGGPAVRRDESGRPVLSPHDRGRLAELGVLARQLRMAPNETERARVRADIESLASHLGLGGATGHSDARRNAAFDALEGHPAAQAALAGAVAELAPSTVRAREILERVRQVGQVDSEMEHLPGEPPSALERRRGESRRVGDRSEVDGRVLDSLRRTARARFGEELAAALSGEIPHNERTMFTLERLSPEQVDFVMRTRRLPSDVDFHHLMAIADFPEFGDRAEVGVGLSRDDHMGLGHNDQPRRPVEAAAPVGEERGAPFHEDPQAVPRNRALRSQIVEGSRSTGDVDRDIAIEQRGNIRRLEAGARALENTAARLGQEMNEALGRGETGTAARLERNIARLTARAARARQQAAEIEAALPGLMDEAARRPVRDEATPLASGTAAAIRGSRFRGDVLSSPRPHPEVLAEAAAAVTRLTAAGGTVPDAHAATQPDGSIVVTLRGAGTQGEDLRVRIIAADSLEPATEGVPVARFGADPDGGADYLVRMSARAPEGSARRALAHELTEIRHAHAGGITHDDAANQLRPGGFGSEAHGRAPPSLTPHDRGRLAEVDVLAHDFEAARLAGDEPRAARIQDEAQRLLAHLGVVDESRGARARLALADRELGSRPELVRRFLAGQAEAARLHPFLRTMPVDRLGRMDLLLDRLAYARRIGDTGLEAQVFRQAQGLITIHEGKIDFVGEGQFTRRSMRWLEDNATPEHPRAALLHDLAQFVSARRLEYRNTQFGRRPPDPAAADPELVAATTRRFGDYRRAQTWEEYRRARLGPGALPTVDELNEAFYEWASGHVARPGETPESLLAGSRRPDVRARFSDPVEVPAARVRMADGTQVPEGEAPRTVGDAIEERRTAMAEAAALREERTRTPSPTPDRLEQIETRLRELIPRINNPTEAVGEAAAIRVAQENFGATGENTTVGRGSGRPDVLVETTQRMVVVEAKGGDAGTGTRLSRDGTRLVEQGTYEYLDSLAASMQRPGNPQEIIDQGRRLETALRTGQPPVEYYLVNQPIPASGDDLPPPTIRRATLRRP